ncbi:Nn.00g045540.m01.CDS01 [Neocucurbitaria sp. VM-36]
MSAGWTNYSVSQAGEDDGPVSVGEDIPACSSCKKRKLRCSRETPTCAHCLRLSTECVYQPKQKPGLKPGAVEALARRVAFLEQILLDDAGNIRPKYRPDEVAENGHGFHDENRGEVVLEVQENVRYPNSPPNPRHNADGSTRDESEICEEEISAMNQLKRKFNQPLLGEWLVNREEINISEHLPPQPLLEKVTDFFCVSFHHWIPYIHKRRLQTRVRDGSRDAGLDLVLHALVAVSLRHMDPGVLFMDTDQILHQSKISRLIVEIHSIRSVSVENVQALIFIVFDYLNDGQNQKAWPLIGSLTRTIDYLQLTTEPTTSQSGSLMTPVRLVRPSSDWTELEERRRLFWIIFLLDRFCSVSTGWNTSLTADDVHRRLPADGGYFTREEPVTTPYFGIWNKAAARIGRSLANVPAQYNDEDPAVEQTQGASPNSANGYIDASKLGAFAYCVEATESLSQVTTFFLQQRINWQDKEHAVSWLTRFKELDLRLVQWKLFLPPRWKDSNISSDRAVVDMDPNLTLAHITHNTSMILLHHPVAYPPKGWKDYVALPKDCSAQTCELAAVETSNIVDKFLAHTPIPFVNVQFSFCAFVAAKALLFEHQATQRPLRPEFQRLTRDLWEMSKRWKGKAQRVVDEFPDGRPCNQAGFYAHNLEQLREACQHDAQFRFDFYDYSGMTIDPKQHVNPSRKNTPHSRSGSLAHDQFFMTSHARQNSINSSQSALSPSHIPSTSFIRSAAVASPAQRHDYPPPTQILSPISAPPPYAVAQASASYPNHGQNIYQMNPNPASTPVPHPQFQATNGSPGNQRSLQDQSLLSLSDAFMDSNFLDMDRVITFEDANFFLPGDAFRWQ